MNAQRERGERIQKSYEGTRDGWIQADHDLQTVRLYSAANELLISSLLSKIGLLNKQFKTFPTVHPPTYACLKNLANLGLC